MDEQTLRKKLKNSNIALTVVILTAIVIIAGILSAMLLMMYGNTDGKKKFTASYLASEVVKRMNYENMSEISKDNIQKYYDIPDELVEDKSMFVSGRSDSFTELACFKLSDKKNEPLLLEIINAYLKDKTEFIKNASENSDPNVSKGKTYCSYPYVFVIISSDCDSAINTFSALLDVKNIE